MAVFTCPSCDLVKEDVPDALVGRRAKCPFCGAKDLVTAAVEMDPNTEFALSDEDWDMPPRHRRAAPRIEFPEPPKRPLGIRICYMLCGTATPVAGVLYAMGILASKNDIGLAAVSAMFAAVVIAMYVVTRCIEKSYPR